MSLDTYLSWVKDTAIVAAQVGGEAAEYSLKNVRQEPIEKDGLKPAFPLDIYSESAIQQTLRRCCPDDDYMSEDLSLVASGKRTGRSLEVAGRLVDLSKIPSGQVALPNGNLLNVPHLERRPPYVVLPQRGFFLIDSVDGSESAAMREDEFSVMIGWIYNGKLRVVVIHNPIKKETVYTYSSPSGFGSWLRLDGAKEDIRLKVSLIEDPKEVRYFRTEKRPDKELDVILFDELKLNKRNARKANGIGLKAIEIAMGGVDWDRASEDVRGDLSAYKGRGADFYGRDHPYGWHDTLAGRVVDGALGISVGIRDGQPLRNLYQDPSRFRREKEYWAGIFMGNKRFGRKVVKALQRLRGKRRD